MGYLPQRHKWTTYFVQELSKAAATVQFEGLAVGSSASDLFRIAKLAPDSCIVKLCRQFWSFPNHDRTMGLQCH